MTEEQRLHEEDLQRIRGFRLFDDDFMNACFDDYIEGTELVLKIIMGRDNIHVVSVKTQKLLKNLLGRDVWLDIHAVDDSGKEFDVEIQRSDRGAGYKRARYHSSMLDSHILKPSEDYDKLPDTHVIFITEHDVIGAGKPIYMIDRQITNVGIPFDDGSHIVYVNGAYTDEATEIGKLMHDFSCIKAADMHFPVLAAKMRFFKETEEGERTMCKVLEDMREETAKAASEKRGVEIAIRLLNMKTLSFEQIAEATGLTLEKVQELASKEIA